MGHFFHVPASKSRKNLLRVAHGLLIVNPMKKIIMIPMVLATAIMFSSISVPTFAPLVAHANEGAADKAADKMEDAKAGTKKMVRKGKRKFRKATGTDSKSKDFKDSMDDAGDDIKKNVNKATN